jgi:hypothetical protein
MWRPTVCGDFSEWYQWITTPCEYRTCIAGGFYPKPVYRLSARVYEFPLSQFSLFVFGLVQRSPCSEYWFI